MSATDDYPRASVVPRSLGFTALADDIDRMLAEIDRLRLRLSLYEPVEPMITCHLNELRMDTDEDNGLLDELRATWRRAATGEVDPS